MELNDAIWRKSTHSGGGGGNCVEVSQVIKDQGDT
jgi:hypothetical protein